MTFATIKVIYKLMLPKALELLPTDFHRYINFLPTHTRYSKVFVKGIMFMLGFSVYLFFRVVKQV